MIEMFGPSITELEKKYVLDAMNNWYGDKKYYYCEKFEEKFAEYVNRKYALMTTNCTSALHLILRGINAINGEVIVPELTWIATTLGACHLNNKIQFADIDIDDWCMSPNSAYQLITEKTKAIIVVNLYGNIAKMDKILELANKYSIPIIEDGAESLGSKLNGKISGSFGIASVFSFHRTKTLTTGEGGMLVTDDYNLYKLCKKLRDLGRDPGTYYNEIIGYKYMPFNMQAALGLAQLERIDELINMKRLLFNRYKHNLQHIDDIQFNNNDNNIFNSAWCTAITYKKPISISVSRPFFMPLSSLPAFNERSIYESINKNSYNIWKNGLNLPSALNMTLQNVDEISLEILNEIQRR